MNPEQVYEKYIAIRLHFTSESYDYFKYGGKTSAGGKSYDKRTDKIQFTKIARNYTSKEIEGLFVSNFVAQPENLWPGHFTTDEAKKIYLNWLKGIQALSYVVKEESKRMKEAMDADKIPFNDMLKSVDGQHPLLLRYYYAREISLETMIVYASIFKFLPKWNEQINDTIVWPETFELIKKYRPFLKYDKDKLKSVIKEVFNDSR